MVAGLIRLVIFLVPLVCAIVVVRACAGVLPAPAGIWGWVVWLLGTTILAMTTVTLVERVTRRALPLAALFKMSLVFPDETPSRMRLALRSGTAKDLERRIAQGGSLGETADEAARNLLILLGRLNAHDRLTRGHSERVRAYSDLIAEEMDLPPADRERLHWAALAHDLGKLTVPPEILNSPDRPTDEEWQILRGHPGAAEHIVEPLRPWLGDWLTAATQHHERWDGRGYPHGLSRDEIHLSGRIVSVADAFDTMTSARSYKKPLALGDARAELARNAGTQFDPAVVRSFMGVGVGRLRLLAGPLSWITSLPTASGVTSIATSGGAATATSSIIGAAAVVASAAGFGAPLPSDDREGSAQAVERVAEEMIDEVDDGFAAPPEVVPPADPDGVDGGSTTTVPTSSTTSDAPTTTVADASTTTAPTTTTSAPSTTTSAPSTTTSTTTTAPTTSTTTTAPTTTTTTTTTTPPSQGLDCADVQGGLRPLTGLDLFNCDLSGFDLAGENLDDVDLDGANLAGANLAGATMKDGDFEGADFSGANLVGADMRFSNWDDSNFAGAVLAGANLRDSNAEYIDFSSADLTSAVLGNTGIRGSNFTDADLTDATGQPNDGPLAIWSNTTCPDGTVQSTSCYS